MDIQCEFCMLASNVSDVKAKGIVITETENAIAFRNMRSKNAVHILVVPKKHVSSILDADDCILMELMSIVKKIAHDVTTKHGACRILANIGEYQDIKHLHWHIVFEG